MEARAADSWSALTETKMHSLLCSLSDSYFVFLVYFDTYFSAKCWCDSVAQRGRRNAFPLARWGFFARLSFQAVLTVLTPTVTHWTCSVCTCVLTGMDLNTVEFLYRLRQTHNFVQMTCSSFFLRRHLKLFHGFQLYLRRLWYLQAFLGFARWCQSSVIP